VNCGDLRLGVFVAIAFDSPTPCWFSHPCWRVFFSSCSMLYAFPAASFPFLLSVVRFLLLDRPSSVCDPLCLNPTIYPRLTVNRPLANHTRVLTVSPRQCIICIGFYTLRSSPPNPHTYLHVFRHRLLPIAGYVPYLPPLPLLITSKRNPFFNLPNRIHTYRTRSLAFHCHHSPFPFLLQISPFCSSSLLFLDSNSHTLGHTTLFVCYLSIHRFIYGEKRKNTYLKIKRRVWTDG